MITGNVKYKITLDPGVWIFDDRKIDLDTYFINDLDPKNELEEYTKSVSKHWDREIQEGAIYPPTLKTEKKYEKEKMLEGTFGIPFHDFLQHAKPVEGATSVQVVTNDGEIQLPIEKVSKAIIGFSKCGSPLKEDGPIHLYFEDGSNKDHPITHISGFIVI